MSHHKRTRSPSLGSSSLTLPNPYADESDPVIPSTSLAGLNIESFEADLCDDELLGIQAESRCDQMKGGRLIRLGGDVQDSAGDGVWVDRYDARLLLSPPFPSGFQEPTILTSPPPASPTGYSDLPSDHEEMFYFDASERQEIAHKKLRRKRDDERQKRIKLREEEEKQREEHIRLSKIPPPEQISLMSRTLEALKSSPAPSLLEIRILTNHGNDPRFSSFLRKDGRYSEYWEEMKSKDQLTKEPEVLEAQKNSLQSIADYGESSDETEVEDDLQDTDSARDGADQSSEKQPVPIDNELPSATLSPVLSTHPSPPHPPLPQSGGIDLGKDSVESSESSSVVQGPESMIIMEDELPNQIIDEAERLRRQARAKEWAERRRKAASIQDEAKDSDP